MKTKKGYPFLGVDEISIRQKARSLLEKGKIRVTKIITRHAGNKPANGGEYEEYHFLIEFLNGRKNLVYKYYFSSFEGWETTGFCEICGKYINDIGSHYSSFHNEEEIKFYDMLFFWVIATARELGKIKTIDITGHKYKPCKIDGGCIICYPCNHQNC